MNHGVTNGIMLAIAWLVLMAVSGLIFNEPEEGPTAEYAPGLIQPQASPREPLRISPYQQAEDAEEENSGGSWKRRRTAFA